MNTPPLLLLAALAFWGWRTGLLPFGLIAGVMLEASRFVPLRWDFSEKELKRTWDLCVLLLIGALAYTYFSEEVGNPTFLSIQWLPLLFLPIMLAQAFGQLEKIPVSTFFLIRLNRPRPLHEGAIPGVNISHPYFGVCLLAAGAVNLRGYSYFVGLCCLTIWALWPHRAMRFSPATWTSLLVVVLGLTFGGAAGLTRLQNELESRISNWITSFLRQDMDPRESRTHIGHIGLLKLSGRIVLRVDAKGAVPALLRKATYDNFQNTTWFSTHREFSELELASEDGYWKLIPNKTSRQEVTIAGYLSKGAGTIALPMGTAEIDKLPVNILKTNALGTVQGAQGPGLVRYVARFGPGISLDGAVADRDTEVPPAETNATATIAAELELAGLPPLEAARRLVTFFQQNFNYTTDFRQSQYSRYDGLTPLSRFLLKTRNGHCEYFATATALLLRQANIPARYVTGYAVQESAGANRYVVRERHAHAWVIYYDREAGHWIELDTTPSGWGAFEAGNASWWEPIGDFLSRVWYQFSVWRWLTERSTLQRYVFGLLVPLIGILAYRLLAARRRGRARRTPLRAAEGAYSRGLDSEFYLIEGRLAELGFAREPWETVSAWIMRLRRDTSGPVSPDMLQTILNLHYRYRFDPDGLSAPERNRLQELVQAWLAEARMATSVAPAK